jgi:hypothetical protein
VCDPRGVHIAGPGGGEGRLHERDEKSGAHIYRAGARPQGRKGGTRARSGTSAREPGRPVLDQPQIPRFVTVRGTGTTSS